MPREHRFFLTPAPSLPATITHTFEETHPAWIRDSNAQSLQQLRQQRTMQKAVATIIAALWKVTCG